MRNRGATFVSTCAPVFEKETLASRLLHKETAFALQRRLVFRGIDMIIVPVQLPKEVW